MNLESQVCSLELSKRLKELGVKQHSLFYWGKFNNNDSLNFGKFDWRIEYKEKISCFKGDFENMESNFNSAFTVSELGEMLPVSVTYGTQHLRLGFSKCLAGTTRKTGNQGTRFSYDIIEEKNGFLYSVAYEDCETNCIIVEYSENEANARALMLIHLLENKLMELAEYDELEETNEFEELREDDNRRRFRKN